MSIAKLTVDLVAQSSQFTSELAKANKSAKTWADNVRNSASEAANYIAGMGAAVATALATMYTVTSQSINEQAKFADRIGITTEALAGLQYAGELTGVATDTVNDSLQSMVERVSEATLGTGEAAEALSALGLSAQTLNQLSPEQQFLEIARAMGEIDNRSDQVRTAIQLFEGEGAALLNTLDLGVDGITAMMDEAENLGIALTRIDAAKVEAANTAFYRSSQSAKGFANALTVELAPIIQGVSTELVRAANEAGGFGEVASEMVDYLAAGFGFLADSIRGWEFIFAGLGQLWKETVFAVVHDITYLDQVMTDLINKLPGANAEYNQTLQTMTRELSAEMLQGREDLETLLLKPLPSESIDQYVHKWRTLSETQAAAIANSKTLLGGEGGEGEGEPTTPTYTDTEKDRMEAELARLHESFLTERQLIDEHERQKLEQLKIWREADIEGIENYETLKTQIEQKADADRAKYDAANNQMLLGNSANLFGSMADLAGTFAGEQSGLYKTMFAVSKAFSIAESIIAIQTGIAKAAATPFPANLAAMASVAAATMGIVSTISGTSMQGVAHSGITDIPREGTWLLNKGERVVDSSTNSDLKSFLGGQNQGGANNPQWTVIVNEAPPGTTATINDEDRIIEIAVGQAVSTIESNVRRGGNSTAGVFEESYGLNRAWGI